MVLDDVSDGGPTLRGHWIVLPENVHGAAVIDAYDVSTVVIGPDPDADTDDDVTKIYVHGSDVPVTAPLDWYAAIVDLLVAVTI